MINGFEQRETQFWNSFDKMVGLVGSARKTELLLRIAIDANTRAKALLETSFEDLSLSPIKKILEPYLELAKKQFGNQLKESFAGEVLDELNSIREIAGALAHAKIYQTRKRVTDHLRSNECSNKINDTQLPGILFENLADEDGVKYGIAYHASPSSDNSTMLEWEIFVQNGFSEVCDELFKRATNLIHKNFSKLVLEEDMSRIMVAMKKGKKIRYDASGKAYFETEDSNA